MAALSLGAEEEEERRRRIRTEKEEERDCRVSIRMRRNKRRDPRLVGNDSILLLVGGKRTVRVPEEAT